MTAMVERSVDGHRFHAARPVRRDSSGWRNSVEVVGVRAGRFWRRVRAHLAWRLDPALSAQRRINALAPDLVEPYGVEIALGDWATPMLRRAIYDGWYEASEGEIIELTVQATDRVLEIGCGIGFLSAIASRAGATVQAYDGNPAMVDVAGAIANRNGATVTVSLGVLQNEPTMRTVPFFVHPKFWASGLEEHADATELDVPVFDFANVVSDYQPTYLLADIEGAETDLLRAELPPCIRRVCVEYHPKSSRPEEITAMLISELSQGFVLDLDISNPPVLYLEREPHR